VPYNVAFSAQGYAAVFARTKVQPEFAWSTYGERLGGFEMLGIFTAYQRETYDRLDQPAVCRMLADATVPMPEPAPIAAEAEAPVH
jgi:hypothetical protein